MVWLLVIGYNSSFFLLKKGFINVVNTIHLQCWNKIIEVVYKKQSEPEHTTFNFRTKKVSAYGMDDRSLDKSKSFHTLFTDTDERSLCSDEQYPVLRMERVLLA